MSVPAIIEWKKVERYLNSLQAQEEKSFDEATSERAIFEAKGRLAMIRKLRNLPTALSALEGDLPK